MQGGNKPSQPFGKGIRPDSIVDAGKFGNFVLADDLAVLELKFLRQSLQFLDFFETIHIPPVFCTPPRWSELHPGILYSTVCHSSGGTNTPSSLSSARFPLSAERFTSAAIL